MTMGNRRFRHAQSVRCNYIGSIASISPCLLKPRNDVIIAIGNNGAFPPCNNGTFWHVEKIDSIV